MSIALPITVTVTERGVTVASPTRTVAMSRFSDRAKRLALDFGVGAHVVATMREVQDLPGSTLTDVTEALS